MNTKKGFTLLELIIVVVVIGILASIALPQYIRFSEKGRASEAKAVLGTIRSAQIRYAAQWGTYTTNNALLDVNMTAPKYFLWNTTGISTARPSAAGTLIVGNVGRNTYQNVENYAVSITEAGNFSGAGNWTTYF